MEHIVLDLATAEQWKFIGGVLMCIGALSAYLGGRPDFKVKGKLTVPVTLLFMISGLYFENTGMFTTVALSLMIFSYMFGKIKL